MPLPLLEEGFVQSRRTLLLPVPAAERTGAAIPETGVAEALAEAAPLPPALTPRTWNE